MCVCVCVFACVHVFLSVCVHVFLSVCLHVFLFVCVCVYEGQGDFHNELCYETALKGLSEVHLAKA